MASIRSPTCMAMAWSASRPRAPVSPGQEQRIDVGHGAAREQLRDVGGRPLDGADDLAGGELLGDHHHRPRALLAVLNLHLDHRQPIDVRHPLARLGLGAVPATWCATCRPTRVRDRRAARAGSARAPASDRAPRAPPSRCRGTESDVGRTAAASRTGDGAGSARGVDRVARGRLDRRDRGRAAGRAGGWAHGVCGRDRCRHGSRGDSRPRPSARLAASPGRAQQRAGAPPSPTAATRLAAQAATCSAPAALSPPPRPRARAACRRPAGTPRGGARRDSSAVVRSRSAAMPSRVAWQDGQSAR